MKNYRILFLAVAIGLVVSCKSTSAEHSTTDGLTTESNQVEAQKVDPAAKDALQQFVRNTLECPSYYCPESAGLLIEETAAAHAFETTILLSGYQFESGDFEVLEAMLDHFEPLKEGLDLEGFPPLDIDESAASREIFRRGGRMLYRDLAALWRQVHASHYRDGVEESLPVDDKELEEAMHGFTFTVLDETTILAEHPEWHNNPELHLVDGDWLIHFMNIDERAQLIE